MDNTGIFGNAYDDEDLEEEVDMNNVISSYLVPHTSFTKFHKDHPEDQGQIDKTLFIKRHKNDIQLVQVYVDNIIFGSTKKEMSTKFEKLLHDKFQMSSMGELSFFLGLQVQQKSNEIFISQDKYVAEILKKFDFASVKTASTPIETNKALIKDEEAEDVDVHLYRSVIRSLMYFSASRPDIMFAVCACARFQVTPKTSHLNALKRIFRYLKGQPKLGIWSVVNFLAEIVIMASKQKDYRWSTPTTEAEMLLISVDSTICIVKNPVFHSKTKHIEIRHHFIRDSYEKRLIQVIKIHTDYNVADLLTKAFDVGDEAVYKELGNRMERAATTASSLEAEQDIEGSEDFHQIIDFLNLSHIKYALTENPTIYTSLIQQFWETASASTSENEEMEITATIDGRVKTITEASIRRHLKLEDSDGIPTLPNAEIFEQLALMGYASDSDKLTFQKGHFSPQWRFLIHTILHCLSPKKTAWEQFSSNIATAIICLATNRTFNFSKMIFEGMLKNLDSSDEGSLTLNELTVIYTTLSKKMEDFQNDLKQTKLTYGAAYTKLILRVKKLEHKIQEDAEIQTRNSVDTKILLEEPTELVEDLGSGKKSEKEVSTAENLVYIRRSAEKRKDKGKAIMKEDESVQKKTKKQLEQERLSHEAAIRLQEQVNEEERQRIARDAEIAKQLQEEIDTARQEQEKSDLEKALELQKQLDEREEVVAEADPAQVIDWSDPAVLRYHAQQNRSFSKAEVRKNMCMYLKNRGGYKQSHFKGMSYEDIRPIFERVWDQNQFFVLKDFEIEKEVMKRSGFDFQKTPAKRQKIREVSGSVEEQSAGKEKDVSEEELKKLLVIVPVKEVYIEALQVKYPIIDWEVFTEESRSYWRIIRVRNHTEVYQVFEDMLKRFDRDDLEKLWDLVKKKFSSTEPTVDKEKRYMHDPLKWRLYDTCGVHHVSTERGQDIFMQVEKDYPLTRALITVMLANKLQVDESLEMANELLRKIFYQGFLCIEFWFSVLGKKGEIRILLCDDWEEGESVFVKFKRRLLDRREQEVENPNYVKVTTINRLQEDSDAQVILMMFVLIGAHES
ncbi:putative ribonuclease H-like domain-containing protein [Tanacetum coccineum]